MRERFNMNSNMFIYSQVQIEPRAQSVPSVRVLIVATAVIWQRLRGEIVESHILPTQGELYHFKTLHA